MTALREAIALLLRDPADQVLASSILGAVDPDAIASRVEAFVAEALGRRIVGCPLFTQSVGAVFGLDLDDGQRVVVKVHRLSDGRLRGHDVAGLAAVYRVQAALAARGLPCAPVLAAPRPFDEGTAAAILGWLDPGPGDDPHRPEARRAMARAMARVVALELDEPALPRSTLPAERFAPPHNALFDLHYPGGEWIDARADRARAVLDALPIEEVAAHNDFSAANVRVVGGEVRAIYDVDSVARIDEMRCLASAAVHYTYRGDPPWRWPTRAEAAAYARDYFDARGRPPDADERARLDAAAIYAMAYTARCGLSLGGPNEMGELLRTAPDAYLSEA